MVTVQYSIIVLVSTPMPERNDGRYCTGTVPGTGDGPAISKQSTESTVNGCLVKPDEWTRQPVNGSVTIELIEPAELRYHTTIDW